MPSPYVTNNHQYKNAKVLADANAAVLIGEKELTAGLLDRELNGLFSSPDRCREMSEAIVPIAAQLGITELLKKYPYEVSGGQKQRAAVARALITSPKLILADEPTGALDSKATDELLRLFGGINASGQTVLMVTHSVKAASHANRVLFIKDGEVYHQLYRGGKTNEQLYQMISDSLTMLQS